MKPYFSAYSQKEAEALFEGIPVSPILEINNPAANIKGGPVSGSLSVSGAQNKMGVLVDGHRLRQARPGEQSTHIVKPTAGNLYRLNIDMAANELLCLGLLRSIFDIPTSASGLCFLSNGSPAFITRRFDVSADFGKCHMEDLSSLAGIPMQGDSGQKYSGSYEGLAKIITRVSTAPLLDLRRFFLMVLANYLLCNGDAHAKNFAMIETPDAAWRLAPAYDVMNTRLHVDDDDFAMSNGLFADGRPCPSKGVRLFFAEWAIRIGLNERMVSSDLKKAEQHWPFISEAIAASWLSKKAQSVFRYHVKQRFARLG